jgi:plastocyanin
VRKLGLAVALAVGALAWAAQAGAANWTVGLGEQGFPPAGTPKGSTLDEFLPGKLVINAGDKVTFSSFSFHTVTFLFESKPPGLFLPDPAKGTYAGINDAAGNPFWFDALPRLIYNVPAFAPIGGKVINGTAPVSSGALSPSGNNPKNLKPGTATYTFPNAGTFHLVCNVHPGMQMDVVVKAAGQAVPLTPTQVSAETLQEQNAGWAKAKAEAAAAKPPANTVYMGLGGAVTILGYFPNTITVKAGATVRWINKAPTEVHNTAFGPSKWIDAFQKKNDLFPMGPKGKNQVSPFLIYGSEPKGKYQYDGTNHGNGVLATPLTAGSPKVPLPKATSVTFLKPGKYKYFCLIHGTDMSGTVIVKP